MAAAPYQVDCAVADARARAEAEADERDGWLRLVPSVDAGPEFDEWAKLYAFYCKAGEWERKLLLREAARILQGQDEYGKWYPGKVRELARQRVEERLDDRIYELMQLEEEAAGK